MIRAPRVCVTLSGGLLLALILLASFAVRSHQQATAVPVAATIPVAITPTASISEAKIGMIVSLGQGEVEGSEWAHAAQGAVVAQYRLSLSGTNVTLLVEDDRGNTTGAREAVAELVKAGVSGIVIASSGEHTTPAVLAANEAGVPVILPYESAPAGTDSTLGVWYFGSASPAVSAELTRTLKPYAHPLLVDAGHGRDTDFWAATQSGLGTLERIRVSAGDWADSARTVARRTGADTGAHGVYIIDSERSDPPSPAGENRPEPTLEQPTSDAVILDGSPQEMAGLVAELEARKVTVPIILMPGALSPGFAHALRTAGGTVSTAWRTIGSASDDPSALTADLNGRAMSAYLQALRELASMPSATNLSGDAPFVDVAPWADARSHDAVIALVTGIARAGSTAPADVRDALTGTKLVAADGIAGPGLDLTDSQASIVPVRTLYASAQPLGLRPQPAEHLALNWMPEPSDAMSEADTLGLSDPVGHP